jgi:hypothetical protein
VVEVERDVVLVTCLRPDGAEVAQRLLPGHEVLELGETPRRIVPRPFVGCHEREPGRLQLRVVPRRDEHVDDLLIAEDDDTVVVLGLVCTPTAGSAGGEAWDVPVHVHLEGPLGERVVVDGSTGERVPVVPPAWH